MILLIILDYIIWMKRERGNMGFRLVSDNMADFKIALVVRVAKYISFRLYEKIITKKDLRVVIKFLRKFILDILLSYKSKKSLLGLADYVIMTFDFFRF